MGDYRPLLPVRRSRRGRTTAQREGRTSFGASGLHRRGLVFANSWVNVGDSRHLGAVNPTDLVAVLREAGARFAFIFGSRARGAATASSDVDVAAFFGSEAPQSFDVLVPSGVDLLIWDRAPLELAGRVSMEGQLLFDDTDGEHFEWLARTRKICADERYRFERAHREFAESVLGRSTSSAPPPRPVAGKSAGCWVYSTE